MADSTKSEGDASEGKPQGIHEFLREWSQGASCNGLGNISGTDQKLRKIIWILIVTAGVGT